MKHSSQVAIGVRKVILQHCDAEQGYGISSFCWTVESSCRLAPSLKVLRLQRINTLPSGGRAFAHTTLSHFSFATFESGPDKSEQIQHQHIRMAMKHRNANQSINFNAWLQYTAQWNESSSRERYAASVRKLHLQEKPYKERGNVFIDCVSYRTYKLLRFASPSSGAAWIPPHLGSKWSGVTATSGKTNLRRQGEGFSLRSQPADLFGAC